MNQAMQVLDVLSLTKHDGPYESWPRVSELLQENQRTGKSIPGYVLEAQFSHRDNYLCITSWDCGEDSLTIVLLNKELEVLDHKTLGAMYSNFIFDSAVIIGQNQVIVYATESPDEMMFRITVGDSLGIEMYSERQAKFVPYPRALDEPKTSSSGFQTLVLVGLLGIVGAVIGLTWLSR